MQGGSRRLVLRYGSAILSVAVAIGLRLLVAPVLDQQSPLITILLAVVFTAWYAGRGPSMMALVLGLLAAACLWLPPYYSPAVSGTANQLSLALEASLGLAVILVAELLRTRTASQETVTRNEEHLAVRQRLEQEIAHRQGAEEALREGEQHVRHVLDSLFAFVGVLTPEGVLTEANRAPLKVAGIRFEDVRGKRFEECYWWNHSPAAQARIRKAIDKAAQGEPSRFDIDQQIEQGRLMTVDFMIAPMRDEQGRITHLIPSAVDITDRKRAEEALRHSEETVRQQLAELNAIYDNAPIGLSVMDTDLRWLRINRRLAEMNGIPPEQHIGRSVRDLLPDLADQAEAMLRQVLQTGQPVLDLEIVGETPAQPGSRRTWRESFLPLRDAEGRIIGLNVVCEDITDRKRTEEALHKTLARLQILSEVTSQLLATDRPQEIIEDVCRKVMDHLECHVFLNFLVEGEDRLRLNACGGVPPDVATDLQWLTPGESLCGIVAQTGSRVIAENISASSDDRVALVRSLGVETYACHPLMNQGRLVGTLSFGSRAKHGFSEDELALMLAVSDQVAIAVERARLMEEVGRQAAEAQAASEAKSRFLAHVSHELRTPMNAILGMTELALEENLATVVRDYIAMAHQSADSLLALLNEILDFSRIESGHFALEPAPFRLREALAEAKKTLTVRAQEKGLALECDVPDEVPNALVGDALRLRQILVNLVGNAIKFTDHGHVAIRARVESQSAAEVRLRFDVEDTGIGIAREQQTQIFAPFVQADSSTTRRQGGTGLGLAIVSSLVQLMGGRVWLESEPGRGSTFSFTAVFVPSTEAALPPADARPAAPRGPAQRPLRVLLAEDTPANQMLVTHILQKRGHAVEVADNGQTALQRLGQANFDVVLMNVQMPAMDGFQATAAIRSLPDPHRARVPIIAMTAHAMKGDADRCLAAGMDAYLSKPIKGEELIALVERLATRVEGEARQGRAGRAEPEEAPPSPDASGEPEELFNPDEGIRLCFGKRELFLEMVGAFFGEADALVGQIREALGHGDLAAVGRIAHRLKGTVVYLGAHPATNATRRVERLASSGAASALPEAINDLETQLGLLKGALRPYQSGALSQDGDLASDPLR
ncbi:MAG: PAS domain-containing protein [Thermoguttaceae bacterium]